MDINGGDKNRVFLHDLIKITEGTVSEGTIFMHIFEESFLQIGKMNFDEKSNPKNFVPPTLK